MTQAREQAGHLLAIHPSAELYGADRSFLRTMEALDARIGGRIAILLSAQGPLEGALRDAGFDVRVFPTLTVRRSQLAPRVLIRSLPALVRSLGMAISFISVHQPSLVYVNTLTQPVWLLAARLRGKAVVCHVREFEPDLGWLAKQCLLLPLALCRLVVANSEATADFARTSVAVRFARTEVSVIYNGYSQMPAESVAPHHRSDSLRCVLPGRLNPRKGQEIALEAAALNELLHIDIVGSSFPGQEGYETKLRRRSLELGPRCRILPFDSDLRAKLGHYDVGIVPSRNEPFGGVAVEMLLAGLPVVLASEGGLGEIASHFPHILTFNSRSRAAPELLAAALAEISQNYEAFASAARAAVPLAARMYSRERYGVEMAQLINRVSQGLRA